MAKRVIVVGVIQGYVVDDAVTDVEQLIREDVAESIFQDPAEYIVFDTGKDEPFAEKLIGKKRIKMVDLQHKMTDKRLCFTCVKHQVDMAVKDYIDQLDDDVPEDDPHRLKCIKAVREHCSLELADEYINEAEHQDGYGYWKQFDTIPQLLEDVDRYNTSKAE